MGSAKVAMCILFSVVFTPPATTAVIGLAYTFDGRGFVGPKKKKTVGLIQSSQGF